ncbi:MAG: response regulator [Propionivibrio sp.]|uniref:Response regulator n=1 Tax=Candidatus Propionivibrio dominans TaxID=2954373 RepID=A0A9D7F6D0_9RHOO|nr:response regulator [Candidatus Propionivibrio dominans]
MAAPDSDHTADLMHKMGKELARMRVLLVDQHASARNSMRIILNNLGISGVHNAGSSAEVLRQVKAYSFDIIFLTISLRTGVMVSNCLKNCDRSI